MLIQPGIYECSLFELNSKLLNSFENSAVSRDQVIFCCQKFWDGELSAYLLTENEAVKVVYTLEDLGKDNSGTVEAVEYKYINSVSSIYYKDAAWFGEYRIRLESQISHLEQFYFSFAKQDAVYERLLKSFEYQIEKVNRQLNTVF
jgi:hypothetical protein